jgi:RNA polymerase sigma-70 factor (ECF subfamily)
MSATPTVRELLEQHVKTVYRFALRLAGGDAHTAEDLAQEAMLRALRHEGRLRDEGSARIWLFRVTANLWRDQLRRTRVHRSWWQRAAGADPPPAPAAAPPERRHETAEAAEAALRALDRLPDRQREVLYLTACEGLCIDEIATVLEIGAGAVRSSLSLARQRLRDELESHAAASRSGGPEVRPGATP